METFEPILNHTVYVMCMFSKKHTHYNRAGISLVATLAMDVVAPLSGLDSLPKIVCPLATMAFILCSLHFCPQKFFKDWKVTWLQYQH